MSDSSGAREDAVIAKYADRLARMIGVAESQIGMMQDAYDGFLREFLGELHGGERDTAGDLTPSAQYEVPAAEEVARISVLRDARSRGSRGGCF